MSRSIRRRRLKITMLLATSCVAGLAVACSAISFTDRPALGYAYGSREPLRIAVIDETAGNDWSPAVNVAVATYAGATPMLAFQRKTDGANIVITIRRYDDGHPPALPGYVFPPNAGGFATVYDEQRAACNFPPSPLPLNCDGQIASVDIYLNDAIPPGPEIESRRQRLLLHEMGHGMGLMRHSADLDITELAARYGWSSAN